MKKTKKAGNKKSGIMARSDIPYAQRIMMRQKNNIAIGREHSAKIAMYCVSIAMHELEGIGYKRLVRFAKHFKEVIDEFYEDPEAGMYHAAQRMEQMGRPISGDFYKSENEGLSKLSREVKDNSLQAVQVALICSAIAMNDEFGFGEERQEKIYKRTNELSGRYAKEGEKFLLEEMEKIGFSIVNGRTMAYMDNDGNGVIPSKAKKEAV